MANNNSGRDKNEKDLVCSFCGKHQDEVCLLYTSDAADD